MERAKEIYGGDVEIETGEAESGTIITNIVNTNTIKVVKRGITRRGR